jgi:hypothetical protein
MIPKRILEKCGFHNHSSMLDYEEIAVLAYALF